MPSKNSGWGNKIGKLITYQTLAAFNLNEFTHMEFVQIYTHGLEQICLFFLLSHDKLLETRLLQGLFSDSSQSNTFFFHYYTTIIPFKQQWPRETL